MNNELKQIQAKMRMQEFQHNLEHTWSLSKMELLRKLSTALMSERSPGFPFTQNMMLVSSSRSMDALNQFDRVGKLRSEVAAPLWSDRIKCRRVPGKRKLQCPLCGTIGRSSEWPARMKRSNAVAGVTDWSTFCQLLNHCLDLKTRYKQVHYICLRVSFSVAADIHRIFCLRVSGVFKHTVVYAALLYVTKATRLTKYQSQITRVHYVQLTI